MTENLAVFALDRALNNSQIGENFTLWFWLDTIQASGEFSATTKEVAYALSTYCRSGARVCWPSLPQIWNACGRSAGNSDRVTKLLTPLVDCGLLEREKRWEGKRSPFAYAIRLPSTSRRVLDDLPLYEEVSGPYRSLLPDKWPLSPSVVRY